MDTDQHPVPGEPSDTLAASEVLQPLRAALAGANDRERYRLLATLFADWADQSNRRRPSSSAEELDEQKRKTAALAKDKAALDDEMAALKAELEHRTARLEAEQERGKQLGAANEEQRARLKSMQQELGDLEAQITAKNAELHKSQVANEELTLAAQRKELEQGDRSGVARLEASKSELAKEGARLRAEMEQLRTDKNVEIARLTEELTKAGETAGSRAEIPFGELWDRLASADPPLVDRAVEPNQKSAERMFDVFIELARFVDGFDQLVRPFLSKYTKHDPRIKAPWDAYAKRDGMRKAIKQTVAPVGGKPIGLVNVQLRGLYAWTEAALIGCDAAIESVASELRSFALGDRFAGSDPNLSLRDFILRKDGGELFVQRVRELRGEKIAGAFR